jgi:hypothetical protein
MFRCPYRAHLKSSYFYAVPRQIADGTPVVLFLNLVPDLSPPVRSIVELDHFSTLG